jgi:DNA modification methylase
VIPADLVEPCIKAVCPKGGTVLDPFAGSGTVLAVAVRLGRDAVGCELNPEYVKLIAERVGSVKPADEGMFAVAR